ncbi:S8 family serine peptidase, partial [Candidatus Peregrinibacteria bacterium]|nr:S8 family serine peptidase [Candidatus Peregrinibacteria bacterium]
MSVFKRFSALFLASLITANGFAPSLFADEAEVSLPLEPTPVLESVAESVPPETPDIPEAPSEPEIPPEEIMAPETPADPPAESAGPESGKPNIPPPLPENPPEEDAAETIPMAPAIPPVDSELQGAPSQESLILQAITAPASADELIVKYKEDASWLDKAEFRYVNDLEKNSEATESLKPLNIEAVRLENEVTLGELPQVIAELQSDPAIEYAEPNYKISVLAEPPDDPEYPRQWALRKINAPEGWAATRGDDNVIIAVLDTGLDYSRADGPENIVPGYDFINGDNDPRDDHGHGTYMAGIIAAGTDNGTGIAGVCPGCSVMPVKVIDGSGMGTYADVAAGIVWAADNGAKIINLSIGGLAYSQALWEAVLYAQSKGAFIIAAGGNWGTNAPVYPAAYPDVIGVSATDAGDNLWVKSNFGEHIDLAAPGVDVLGPASG